ncbi:MAG: hypothetical protein V3T83_09645 [Acidobacteriota bacterium]
MSEARKGRADAQDVAAVCVEGHGVEDAGNEYAVPLDALSHIAQKAVHQAQRLAFVDLLVSIIAVGLEGCHSGAGAFQQPGLGQVAGPEVQDAAPEPGFPAPRIARLPHVEPVAPGHALQREYEAPAEVSARPPHPPERVVAEEVGVLALDGEFHRNAVEQRAGQCSLCIRQRNRRDGPPLVDGCDLKPPDPVHDKKVRFPDHQGQGNPTRAQRAGHPRCARDPPPGIGRDQVGYQLQASV